MLQCRVRIQPVPQCSQSQRMKWCRHFWRNDLEKASTRCHPHRTQASSGHASSVWPNCPQEMPWNGHSTWHQWIQECCQMSLPESDDIAVVNSVIVLDLRIWHPSQPREVWKSRIYTWKTKTNPTPTLTTVNMENKGEKNSTVLVTVPTVRFLHLNSPAHVDYYTNSKQRKMYALFNVIHQWWSQVFIDRCWRQRWLWKELQTQW